MAPLLSILNKQTPYRFANGSNGESLMELELVENVKHNYRTSITRNAADASTVNDNIKNEPVNISMICRISNNPVSLVSNVQGTVSSLLPSNPIAQEFFGTAIVGLSNEFLEKSTDRRQDFFDKLINIRDNKIPFDVITGLKVYQNMFFKALTIDEDKSAINSLIFSCVLEEIDLKSLVTEFQTQKKKNLGLQKLDEVREESILRSLVNKFV
jgi:hypothetical protein